MMDTRHFERVTATSGGAGVHRLRELSARGRVAAAALGLCLVLAHVVALVRFGPDWLPGGDIALMAIRSLDAFTSRLPLVGQPSTSGLYGGFTRHAFHPGPMQFYMSAPFVRLVGATAGMLTISVLVTSSSVLIATWVLFRQLGAFAGVVGAVTISLVMFTTGSSSLIDPVSSVVSGYPLLCGAVLVYGLVCGDDRLLVLAVVVLSFAGQAHLAVGPSVLIVSAVGVVGVGLTWWRDGIRHDAAVRRHALRWGGGSLLLGVALWLPVIYQQFHGDPGNLTAVAKFTADSDRPSMGYGSALRQVTHALGLPPLLGRTDFSGRVMIAEVSPFTAVSAGVVVAVLAVAWYRWRQTFPRRSRLVVMAGVMAVSGVLTGSSVPASLERGRRSFYHWAWPLTVFAVLALAYVVRAGLGRVRAWRGTVEREPRPGWAVAGIGLAVSLMAGVTLVNPSLDRLTNTLPAAGTTYPRHVPMALVDQMVAAGIGDIDGDLVVVPKHARLFDGTQEAVSLQLMERGYDVAFPLSARDYVADEHLVSADRLGAVLLLVTEGVDPDEELPGVEIAREPLVAGFDRDAYDGVVATAEGADGGEFVPGPKLQRLLDSQPTEARNLMSLQIGMALQDPGRAFSKPGMVDFLLRYPTAEPAFDRGELQRLRRSLEDLPTRTAQATDLVILLVKGDEARQLMHFAPRGK